MLTNYNFGPLTPPALPRDDGLYNASTTQLFACGTRCITWDGRVYKYSRAVGTLNPDMGVKCYATQNLAYAAIVKAQTAGTTEVSCTFGSADGYANSGLVVKDELAGGYCIIFSDTVPSMGRGIIGNSGVAAGGGTGIIYVDQPFNENIATATSYIEAMGSPYYDVRHDADGTKSVIGLPLIAATSGQFTWLQTWGPCWIAPQSGVGNSAYVRSVYARHDGSLDIRANIGTYVTDQCVGFVLQNAQAGTQGAPFIMLTISV